MSSHIFGGPKFLLLSNLMIWVLIFDDTKTSVSVQIDDEVLFAMPCVVIKDKGLHFLLNISGHLSRISSISV